MDHHPLVSHVIALIESWNANGWGEYLLHEVLEGVRDRPFKLMDPLPEADLAVCRRLREELKLWVFYDGTTGTWETVDLEIFREFAKETTANDIVQLTQAANFRRQHR